MVIRSDPPAGELVMRKRLLTGAVVLIGAGAALAYSLGFPYLDPERVARKRAERPGVKLSQAKVDEVWFGHPVVAAILEGEHVTDADMAVLLDFPHLLSVTLANTKVAGSGLRTLANVPKLKRLELHRNRLDPWDLAWLLNRKPHLEVKGEEVDGGVVHLPLTRKLEWVPDNSKSLVNTSYHIAWPKDARLGDQPVLALNLANSRITDADLPELVAEFPEVRLLYLDGTAVTPAGIPDLARLHHLTRVSLPKTFNRMDWWRLDLTRLCHLEHVEMPKRLTLMNWLQLVNAHPGLDESLAWFRGLFWERDSTLPGSPITRLQIRVSEVEECWEPYRNSKELDRNSDHLVEGIGRLDQLREFSLIDGYLTDAGLRHVADLRRLEVLDLIRNRGWIKQGEKYYPGITEAGISLFAGRTVLREIWLNRVPWTSSIIPELARLPGLEMLGLLGNPDSYGLDETVEELAVLKQLRHLDLGTTLVGREAVDRLRKALPNCNVVWHHPKSPHPPSGQDKLMVYEPLLRRGERAPSLARERMLLGARSFDEDNKEHPREVLDLRGTGITDQWLDRLAGRTEVRQLDLSYTKVTNEGLKVVAGLRGLTHLRLDVTEVTDAGVKRLTALPKLEWLDLYRTAVTDDALAALAGMQRLRDLSLGATAVTDAGVKRLAALPHLRSLFLDYTAVTDDALAALAGAKRLHHLSLRGAKNVTMDGVRRFRVALPDCRVVLE
jgi:hypothetical protein